MFGRVQRAPKFPCLPGYNFDTSIGRTKFNRSQIFEKIHDGVYYLADRSRASEYGDDDRSIYPRGEAQMLPAWIALDGQRLVFKAYFQETVQERWQSCFQVRVVTITFFLEDGTMKIVEPAIDNSGLEQGLLVKRQKIPLPKPVKNQHYDVLDLNIGKELEIYGRVYRIVDCAKFTRHFLNRMGIPVPDPIQIPNDGYEEKRIAPRFAKKPNRRSDTRGKFLKYDGQVLRFYAYWDDRDSEYGTVHDLELRYYLTDDTIEIKEPKNARVLLKKSKIPKFFKSAIPIGSSEPFTVLNVLGDDTAAGSYYTIDPLNTGTTTTECYEECDLAIGAQLDVFGRKVVIIDLDPFTKEYYRVKYGLDDFKALESPSKSESCSYEPLKYIPPYNGFGSYDDSLGNCLSVTPATPRIDFTRIHKYDKEGYDSRVLRFRAKMESNVPEYELRHFIVRVYPMDDTVSIFELAHRNTGFERRLFQKRMRVMLPGQNIYSSVKPKYYEPGDFYIGARVNLCEFHFRITSADEYALRYMEINCDKFPKSNVKLVMEKLRKGLEPVYEEFVSEYGPREPEDEGILTYRRLREALCKYLGDELVEHEMITIARYYSSNEKRDSITREYVRRLVHTEITRLLWNELDRLEEDIRHWDRARTGYLPRSELYSILRGCRIPVDPELVNSMLDHLKKNDRGLMDYRDLLQFLNTKINPVAPMAPVNIKTRLWWASEKEPDCGAGLDWCAFLKDLDAKHGDPVPRSLGNDA